MNIFWLQQAEPDVPVDDQWLTPDELNRLRGMGFPPQIALANLGKWAVNNPRATQAEIDALIDEQYGDHKPEYAHS